MTLATDVAPRDRVPDDGHSDAEAIGLVYASPDEPGLSRRRAGRGFTYRWPDGRPVRDPAVLKRVRSLVIPPAWRSVWICADPRGHIQAMGVDERGRRQYRYHPRFRAHREESKFAHILAFAAVLPALREKVAKDMSARGLSREKVLATVVHLLETTLIRVGNPSYARANHSYGLTTLLSRHVDVEGAALEFHFKGKSGRSWRLGVRDRRVARIVRTCQELPGQHLFQYFDEAEERRSVTSADVNDYLRLATGADVTAKDFRTWSGTLLTALALADTASGDAPLTAKRAVTRAIESVAARLGNTPAICRKCYVHPEVVSAYLDDGAVLTVGPMASRDDEPAPGGLRPEEAALLDFLRTRIDRESPAAAARHHTASSRRERPLERKAPKAVAARRA